MTYRGLRVGESTALVAIGIFLAGDHIFCLARERRDVAIGLAGIGAVGVVKTLRANAIRVIRAVRSGFGATHNPVARIGAWRRDALVAEGGCGMDTVDVAERERVTIAVRGFVAEVWSLAGACEYQKRQGG